MNFGQIGAGLANMYPGMVQGRMNEAEARLKELAAAEGGYGLEGLGVQGKGLLELFGGQGGQSSGLPAPAPGAPSVPRGGGPGPSPVGGMPAPGPGVPSGGPVPAAPPGGGGGPAAVGQPTGAEQPLQGPGTTPDGRPAMFGNAVVPGRITWQAIVSAIAKANPGASPQAIAKAVDRFQPLMTAESQMQWHLLQMQNQQLLRDKQEGGKTDRAHLMIEDRQKRAAEANALRGQAIHQSGENALLRSETQLELMDRSQKFKNELADFIEGKKDARQFNQLRATEEWKQLDRESREDIANKIREAQNERAAAAQAGQTERTNIVQGNANQRAADRNATTLEVQGNKPVTGTQARLDTQGNAYNEAINTAKDAIKDVLVGHKEGKNVVGLTGAARGINELIGNVGGWNEEAKRAAFAQKINILRNTVPALLGGRINLARDERIRINQIIPGLEPGSTKPATVGDLRYLINTLEKRRPLPAATTQRELREGVPAGSTRAPKEVPAAGAAATTGPTEATVRETYEKGIAAGLNKDELDAKVKALGFDASKWSTSQE